MPEAAIGVEIEGLEEAQAAFRALAQLTPEAMGLVRVMSAQAEGMMTASKLLCPVVTNTLRSSGKVDPPKVDADSVEITLGYGGAARKYARKVHENPRTGRTGGFSPKGKKYYPRPGLPVPYSQVGQWKFLEQPVAERRQAYFDALARDVGQQIEALAAAG
jgi:hypothetical protein